MLNRDLKIKKSTPRQDVNMILDGLNERNRISLSRAITILESKSRKDQNDKQKILEWSYTQENKAYRIGITGSPGAGKSTLIESLGSELVLTEECDIAVLSIDPSSYMSKGSILGDKTRMQFLSQNPRVFIRPSPAHQMLGGVASATRETIMLCEAFGFKYIMVETVGVGQSEHMVHQMTDLFILVLLPGAGDSLQGIKRGIVEMADMILVNKSEGDRQLLAADTRRAYKNALRLMPQKDSEWITNVQLVSALNNIGIEDLRKSISEYFEHVQKANYLTTNRARQAEQWFQHSLVESLVEKLEEKSNYRELRKTYLEKVRSGNLAPGWASKKMIEQLFSEW